MPQNPNELSPLTLAFVGDGVYSLLVRERLAQTNRPAGELHRLSVKQVNARAQAGAAAALSGRPAIRGGGETPPQKSEEGLH